MDPKPNCSKRGIVAICKTCCKAYDQTLSGEQGLQRERSSIRLKLGFKQKAKVAADTGRQSAVNTKPFKKALQRAATEASAALHRRLPLTEQSGSTSTKPDWYNREKSVAECDARQTCR